MRDRVPPNYEAHDDPFDGPWESDNQPMSGGLTFADVWWGAYTMLMVGSVVLLLLRGDPIAVLFLNALSNAATALSCALAAQLIRAIRGA